MPTLERLPAEQLDTVVAVLADAFVDYPVMRYVLGGADDYATRLPVLIRLFASGRALRQEPMLGLRDGDGELLAVALMTPPDSVDAPAALLALRESTWAELGDAARKRYDTLVRVWTACEGSGRRHHLNMIGVRSRARGRGLARPLLQAVIDAADADSDSIGVDLTTELAANLPLYLHFGFEVGAHARVAPELETWNLFRPRSATPRGAPGADYRHSLA